MTVGLVVSLVAGSTPAPAQSQASSPKAGEPISLGRLLERVQTRYPLIGAANARANGARGARRAAGAFPNPVIGFGLENVALPGRSAAIGMDRQATATATVPLEFLYQRSPRLQRADARVQGADADAFAERQRIAMDAVHRYYVAALAEVELNASQDLAIWVDSLVMYNRTRASEGIGAEADLLRAQLERDRVWAEVTTSQAHLARARADLGALYSDSAGLASIVALPSVLVPDAPLPLPRPTVAPSTAAPADQGRGIAEAAVLAGSDPNAAARAQLPPSSATPDARAEVQSARARLTAASANVGVARSMFVRDLSAMVGLKQSAGTTTLLTGLSLPLPLVDQNRGALAEARADREVATFELGAIERQVRAEVVGAVESARLLAGRVDALRGSADSARTQGGNRVRYLARADEVRTISLGAYREGAVPLFQVLDAARTWSESRLTYYRTLYAQHESVAAVLMAEGRDLFAALPALAALADRDRVERASKEIRQ